MRELEESMDHAEWDRWLLFYSLYDLPDAYFTTVQIGCLIAAALGNRLEPGQLAAVYRPDQPERASSRGVPEFIAFAKSYLDSGPPRRPPRGGTPRE